MLITRVSMFSGKTHTIEIAVTPEQLGAWMSGVLIQNACPNLSAHDREFIVSGVTKEEWLTAFASDEDEEDVHYT